MCRMTVFIKVLVVTETKLCKLAFSETTNIMHRIAATSSNIFILLTSAKDQSLQKAYSCIPVTVNDI